MPFVRRRPLLRAAVVGGAAYHAGKRVQEGRDADYERDARMDDLEAQQASMDQQQAAPAPAAPQQDPMEQLEKLAKLKEQGILTDVEFEVQKQKILQGMS
jgi:putative oligomerization/nucleic acid binding protein